MVNAQTLLQLKAFARQDGAILAVAWLISLWCTFKTPDSIWGPLIILSTPIFIVWRLQSFRDSALDGVISFRRGFAFSCYVFFYASLIFALGQYVYFAYLDNGAFMKLLTESLALIKPYYIENGVSEKDLDLALKTIQMMKPVHLAFTFMTYNLMIGAIASLVISLICQRRTRKY